MTHFSMQPTENKGLRLFKLREKLGLTQKEFTEKLDIAQNNLSNLERGKRQIGKNISKNIITTFNVNPIWWETGEGKMFNEVFSQGSFQMSTQIRPVGPRSVEPYIKEQLVKIPLVEINARAGFVENLDNYTEYISEYTYILPEAGERYENAIAVTIDGDSMEPQLERGDKVLVIMEDKGDWGMLNPGVYAVVYRNSFSIKRIKRNTLQSAGTLELHSDNSDKHGVIDVKLEDIRGIWKVVRILSRRVY